MSGIEVYFWVLTAIGLIFLVPGVVLLVREIRHDKHGYPEQRKYEDYDVNMSVDEFHRRGLSVDELIRRLEKAREG